MTHNLTVALAVLGIAGQVIALGYVVVVVLAGVGVARPLELVRAAVWGYELWGAFAISALAMAGSLYYSEVANFVPCELCWYQRICMYPLAVITLSAAIANDYRVARYLLPLPIIGACIAVYHVLVENGVVDQSNACLVSAPGGCATKWIDEFGYVTIPILTLTAFVLLIELLGLAALGGDDSGATVVSDA